MSSTGGFGADEPIVIRMRESGAAQVAAAVESVEGRLKGLQVQMERMIAVNQKMAGSLDAVAAGAVGAAAATASAGKKQMSALAATSGKLKSIGGTLKGTGDKLSRGISLPLAVIGTVAIASSLKFSKAMLQIQTAAGRGGKEVKMMTAYIHSLAGKQPFDPQKLAQAAVQIEKIGYHGKVARAILLSSAKVATIGGGDPVELSGIVAGAMTAGIHLSKNPVRNAKLIAQAIGAAASAGGTTLPEMAQAFGTGILPYSKLYGFGLKDTLAMLALTSDEHTKPAFAAARMRTAFGYLATPTMKGATEMAKLGLGKFELSRIMKSKGINAMLDRLHQALLGAGDEKSPEYLAALNQILPTGRGAIIAQILNQRERLGFKQHQIAKISSRTDKNFGRTMKNPATALDTAISNLKDSFILLGNSLVPVVIPAIIKFIGLIVAGVKWFNKLNPTLKKWLIYLAIGLTILGPMLTMIGLFIIGISALLSPITLWIIGIGLLVAGLVYCYYHFQTFHKVVDFLGHVLARVAGWIINNWKTVAIVLIAGWDPFLAIPLLIIRYWGTISGFFGRLFGRIGGYARTFIRTIKTLLGLLGVHGGGGQIDRNSKTGRASIKATAHSTMSDPRTSPIWNTLSKPVQNKLMSIYSGRYDAPKVDKVPERWVGGANPLYAHAFAPHADGWGGPVDLTHIINLDGTQIAKGTTRAYLKKKASH